jgi:hypothetical protein
LRESGASERAAGLLFGFQGNEEFNSTGAADSTSFVPAIDYAPFLNSCDTWLLNPEF